MEPYLLDVLVSPVEELLYILEDNLLPIGILLLFFLLLSSVLVTVFVTKKRKNDEDMYHSDEDKNIKE